ncbi:hypothetical protein GDO86_014265 [Hymenochirus boettgeri]|uniref:PEHE domain-containing protein n=1 Tax=Hymenochirus boettgeri TaxID=247094 RepID=A0A8T2JSC4_9PIPI|nr:hypothetical protein GDO86_014265 [Hymenochirus boettgeri]
MSMRSSVCRPRPDEPSLGEEPQESPGLTGRSRPHTESWAGERGKGQAGPGDPCGKLGCEAGALADKGAGGAAGAAVTGAGATTTAATGQGQAPASSSTSPGARWRPPLRGSAGPGACLKQIVLLQLDLIEQQQQRIQDREREIGELKAEKDTLLARIERMERRMLLVRKDSEKEKQRSTQNKEPSAAEMPEGPLPESAGAEKFQQEVSPHLTSLGPKSFSCGRNAKGHKRRSAFGGSEHRTPVKRLTSDLSKIKNKLPQLQTEVEDSETGGSLSSETACQRGVGRKETPEKSHSPLNISMRSTLGASNAPSLKDNNPHPSEADLPYLTTTDMYLSRWHQPPPSPLREPSPKKEESVAIPSWREHYIEPLQLTDLSDVPENLDDAVFAKRHVKLELDEKRRKRWDIQRIREQRILQRLQLRTYKKKGSQECEPEVTSFFPDVDDVQSVMITPYLPVVVFGHPLPKITPQNFELPWLDDRSRCRLEMQKKQTPHRTPRK